jgi:hypothetical protein
MLGDDERFSFGRFAKSGGIENQTCLLPNKSIVTARIYFSACERVVGFPSIEKESRAASALTTQLAVSA